MKTMLLVGLSMLSINALASEKLVPIGPTDNYDFICTVNQGIGDATQMNENMWTILATGGKFVAIKNDQVRVASSSATAAASDAYDFYKKNYGILKSYIRDTGTRTLASIVKGCVPDPSSSRGASVKALPVDAYKTLIKDTEHFFNFLSLIKENVSEDQIFSLANPTGSVPSDAFERKDFIHKKVEGLRGEISTFKGGPFVLLNKVQISAYNFDNGDFQLKGIGGQGVGYEYSYEMNGGKTKYRPPGISYNLSAGLQFSSYKPKNIDEAKKIEKARAAGSLTLRTYVQPTKAWLNAGKPTVNGIVAMIEVVGKNDEIYFKIAH